ncbi:Type I restriction enzyme R protein [Streptococcus parauberis]|nr:Type I restriction enzyme R protein [Streptococcus parauberis]
MSLKAIYFYFLDGLDKLKEIYIAELIEEITRTIRSSIGNRAKEGLIVDFIHNTNLDALRGKTNILESFFAFARKEKQKEVEQLIREENLNEENAKRYIMTSLKKEYAIENGTELNETLPKISPLNPNYKIKKQMVFGKISELVEK